MKNSFLLWSFVIALGGFLFGFDTAVISGAEKSIQGFWSLNFAQQGLAISMALFGTFTGSLLGGLPCDKFGRKKTLYMIGGLYLFSSLGTALAENWSFFLIFRFLGGLGVGASCVTVPIYISEISPANKRGGLVSLFQINIVSGILVSYLSNYLINQANGESWRLMLGIQVIPSLLFIYLLRFVPESPRWLIAKKSNLKEASTTLRFINPKSYDLDVVAIRDTVSAGPAAKDRTILFSRIYKVPVTLAILFAFFNQVSGINAIIYYSPR